MAGYPGLMKISDPAVRQAVQALTDRVAALETRLATLESTALTTGATVDVGGQRIANVAAPSASTDAVNYSTLINYVQGQIKGLTP